MQRTGTVAVTGAVCPGHFPLQHSKEKSTMNTRFHFGALAAATTLIFTAAACGTATTPAASSPAESTNPSAVGSMSMPTDSSMSPASSPGAMPMSKSGASTGQHNDADVTFAQMMIEHHRGAIEMADLAPSRAASDKVKQLAAKIKAAQAPEIEQMSGWLTAWGTGPAASSSAMGGMSGMSSSSAMGSMSGMAQGSSASMPGMMSGEQMDQLTAATGAAFDKMFLQSMMAHHQGALEMAKTEKKSGQNRDALALADSIISSQTAEIATMKDMLKGM